MINREGKVFISYAHEDYEESYILYKNLKNSGIDVWFDKEDLLPGEKFDFEIRNVIKNSSYFIAIISKNSVNKRGYVQKELKLGLDVLREFPENKIYLIPVRIDESTPIADELRQLHWVDMFDNWKKGLDGLLKVLISKEKQITNRSKKNSNKSNNYKILFVDDDRLVHLATKGVLEEEGYSVIAKYSGNDALNYFEITPPDLVVLDIQMPNMNGLDVLRKMKETHPHIPVILYSAFQEFKQDLSSWASDDYIVKSADFKELKDSIKRNLNS